MHIKHSCPVTPFCSATRFFVFAGGGGGGIVRFLGHPVSTPGHLSGFGPRGMVQGKLPRSGHCRVLGVDPLGKKWTYARLTAFKLVSNEATSQMYDAFVDVFFFFFFGLDNFAACPSCKYINLSLCLGVQASF